MAFYSYFSTKIIMAFITKSYQNLFGVRSYINAKKYSGTEGKLDVKEPIYKYILPPRYKTRPLQQPCLNKLVSPLFQPPEAMNVFS